jgi:hypothetical protein
MKLKLAVVLLTVWATCLFAQVTNAPADPVNPVNDQEVRAFFDQQLLLKLFIVPITTVLVMGIKKMIGAIPVQLWPWITPFLGVGLDYLGSKVGIWTGSAEAGGIMGGLAVWFHQLGTQTKDLTTQGAKASSNQTPT